MSDDATKSISATFDTREAADMAIERLVQQYGLNRADVFAEAAGPENTAGNRRSGGDAYKDGATSEPQLDGKVKISADVAQDQIEKVRETFREMGGREVKQH